MKNSCKLKVSVVLMLMAVAACSVDSASKNKEMNGGDLVYMSNPEPVNGKLDVYATMARAAKYNVDIASQNLKKKIYNQNPNLKPQEIIDNVMSSDVNDQSRLFASSRVLEFATIYAMANLNDNSQFMDNYLYNKSAQHLSAAAIKVHQDAWFANKKIREIGRLVRAEKKKSDELKEKMERQGMLGNEDLTYKKNLDVALLKLGEFQQSFAMNMVEYEQITKVLPKEINLEGRRFYELEDFDKNFNIDVFQEAAVRNRKEFALAKEKVKNYSFLEVRYGVLQEYPLIKRLDINGLKIEDSVYEKELYGKVMKITSKLMDDVRELQQSKAGSEARTMWQRQVFDDLAAAILTQIEVSYQLVKQADADLDANEREVAKLKKEIKRLEKIYRASVDEKVELLNDKISMVVLEQKSSQIKAERAMALRNLYFNAGLSPFSKTLLKGKIDDISVTLREAFNKNLVEMLSTVSMQMKTLPLMEQTNWAKGDNWLEDVMKENPKSKPRLHKSSNIAPQVKADAKSAQLGSYESLGSAQADWQSLSSQFAVLKKYQPKYEQATVDGALWYRLRIYAPSTEVFEICAEVIGAGFECLAQ